MEGTFLKLNLSAGLVYNLISFSMIDAKKIINFRTSRSMAYIGSKTSITDLMKLRRALITILVLPESLFYFSQNLVSCKYLLPRDEISKAAFNHYLVSILFRS